MPAIKAFVGHSFRAVDKPVVDAILQVLDRVKQPKAFIYTCNAGMIPPDHWTQDLAVGGGRIVGEACHFIDLLRFLAGSPISDVHITTMGRTRER